MTGAGEWLRATPTGLALFAILTLFGVLAKQWVPWFRLRQDRELSLTEKLVQRVDKLERSLERARARERATRARHEAERSLDRHRLNNVTQCFDAMILLLEATPERASEIVPRIKQMRAEQIKAEALEKSAIYAAAIEADHEEDEEDDA